jgi:DnaK suppressor protein
MTKSEFDRFSGLLTAKRAELSRALGLREDIVIERSADALDETQFAAARELRTRTLERESSLLRDVRLALGRIADGSYGECLQCEEEISPRRLNAIPWATRCIRCQEQADRRPKQSRFVVSDDDYAFLEAA